MNKLISIAALTGAINCFYAPDSYDITTDPDTHYITMTPKSG
jgi:hypothetical protein